MATSKRIQKTKQTLKKKKSRGFPSHKYTYWFTAFALLCLSFAIRLYAFETPILGDEAAYSLLGKRATLGYRPYIDFYEMKPPLLFYVYGLGNLIFGMSTFGLRILGFALVLVNVTLVFLIANEFSQKYLALVIAGLAFFFMNNAYTYATETVSEHFYMVFILSGYYLLIKKYISNKFLNILCAGFLICGAAMIKQTAALFGIGAIVFVINHSLNNQFYYSRVNLIKELVFLALGALLMVAFNLLTIIFAGAGHDAYYWLFEFPYSYVNKVSSSDAILFLKTLGGRAIRYQNFTIIFVFASIFFIVFSKNKRYFSFLLILLICSLLNTIPGFRFYGQYWIPLFTIAPLFLVALFDITENFKNNKLVKYILPIAVLTVISADLIQKGDAYFEKGYLQNSESAHLGNYPIALKQITDDLNNRMLPHETFADLGSQPHAYFNIGRFQNYKHFYPKMISRPSDRNQIYQREAFEEIKNSNPDYVILSVSGIAWRSTGEFDDWLYQSTFRYVTQNYKPLMIFNMDEKKFYNAENENYDLYRSNQLISFKRK